MRWLGKLDYDIRNIPGVLFVLVVSGRRPSHHAICGLLLMFTSLGSFVSHLFVVFRSMLIVCFSVQ